MSRVCRPVAVFHVACLAGAPKLEPTKGAIGNNGTAEAAEQIRHSFLK